MKWLSIIVFVILFSCHTFIGQEVKYAEVKAHTYNDYMSNFSNSPITLSYNENNEKIWLIFKDFPSTLLYIKCDNSMRRFLRKKLDKYFKWNRKADSLRVKIEKAIDYIRINNRSTFLVTGSESYLINNGALMTLTFFSQKVGKHQLVISFDKVQATQNEFITHKMSSHYLWYNEVKDLRDKLDESKINKWLEKQKRQESIENQFK